MNTQRNPKGAASHLPFREECKSTIHHAENINMGHNGLVY
jgi:hypothetical protein